MDWASLFSAFGLIFLAELGDKTQLTVMSLASQSESPWLVFAGAALALAASSLLAMLFGSALTRVVPEQYIHMAAGAAFIVMGVLLLTGRL